MLTRTDAGMRIDAVHARAICDEIGERLGVMLRRSSSHELPPRLRDLMDQLARRDDEASPSIVPTLEEMLIGQTSTIDQSSGDGRHRR
jgi:hypothetical protein